MTFKVQPQTVTNGAVQNAQNCCLRIAANSIVNILPYVAADSSTNFQENTTNGPIWIPQDRTNYGPPYGAAPGTINYTHAEGVERFEQQYKHFTVLGSRCQATFEPFGTEAGDPATMYLGLNSAPASAIQSHTPMSEINSFPFFKRAQILGAITSGSPGQGARLYQNYSTKRFEGVKDVMDNAILRGSFATTPGGTDYIQPNEKSFFMLGLMNTISNDPAEAQIAASDGILRVKVEYIVKLSEPTTLNTVSQPTDDGFYVEMGGKKY